MTMLTHRNFTSKDLDEKRSYDGNRGFPKTIKRRKVSAIRDFPTYTTAIKRRKVSAIRDFPPGFGPYIPRALEPNPINETNAVVPANSPRTKPKEENSVSGLGHGDDHTDPPKPTRGCLAFRPPNSPRVSTKLKEEKSISGLGHGDDHTEPPKPTRGCLASRRKVFYPPRNIPCDRVPRACGSTSSSRDKNDCGLSPIKPRVVAFEENFDGECIKLEENATQSDCANEICADARACHLDDKHHEHQLSQGRSKYNPPKEAKVKFWDPNSSDYNWFVGSRGDLSHSEEKKRIREALELFSTTLMKLVKKYESKGQFARTAQVSIEAANIVKQKMAWLGGERVLGHVRGVDVGDRFEYRAQLHMVGLHHQYTSGIDYMDVGVKILATSIVNSQRYNNIVTDSVSFVSEAESLDDILHYAGQGGNPNIGHRKIQDQKLQGGNLALKNCISSKTPVRVIQKRVLGFGSSDDSSTESDKKKNYVYVYDGLYLVTGCTRKRGTHGKWLFVFELKRVMGEPESSSSSDTK